jgi:uncharacterized membrane protein YdfJ with MMPL/SSD domain
VDSLNLAARAGRWSANNWKKAFFGWLVLALAALVVGSVVGHKQIADSDTASGEAATAQRLLEQAGFKAPATESVLVQSDLETLSSFRFHTAVAAVVNALSDAPNVKNIQNPLILEGGGGQVSEDGHAVLVQFDVAGDADDAADKVEPILDRIAAVQKANPALRIEEFGMASATHVLNDTLGEDFKKAEKLTLPVTLLILLFAFGAVVAAGLPVLLAFSAVLASIGLYSLFTHLLPGDFETTQSVDPADRDGGRRRLLAVLSPSRA